jgi:hypothetical protein
MKGWSKEEVYSSFLQTFDHEIIHIFDLLRSGNKTNSYKQKKEHGSISKYNELITNADTNVGKAVEAYLNNDLEKNRLFNQLIRFLKRNDYYKKITNKKELLKYVEDADSPEIAKAVINNEKLYRSFILRLNREGVLSKEFKS